jgi:hypothetical protein
MAKIDHIFISPYELQIFKKICLKRKKNLESFRWGIIPLEIMGFCLGLENQKMRINYIKY